MAPPCCSPVEMVEVSGEVSGVSASSTCGMLWIRFARAFCFAVRGGRGGVGGGSGAGGLSDILWWSS
jgi:hypothetical protein